LYDAEDEILNQISRLNSIDILLDREHAQLIFFAMEPCSSFLAIGINEAISRCYHAKYCMDDCEPVRCIPNFRFFIKRMPMFRAWELLPKSIHKRSDHAKIDAFEDHEPENGCQSYDN